MLCCGYTLTDFPISIRLTSLALWQSNDCPSASKATPMNMDKYFMLIHYERLHNHNKAKHNKTVYIFLRIYCITYNTQEVTKNILENRESFHDWLHEKEHSTLHPILRHRISWFEVYRSTLQLNNSAPLAYLMLCSSGSLSDISAYLYKSNFITIGNVRTYLMSIVILSDINVCDQ